MTAFRFVISTTFPSYEEWNKEQNIYKTDTPTGMTITNIEVKVGEVTLLSAGSDYIFDKRLPSNRSCNGANFAADYIGTENTHAGKTVTVNVTVFPKCDATVRYSNAAAKFTVTASVDGKRLSKV